MTGDIVFNPACCFLYDHSVLVGERERVLREITNSRFLDVRTTSLVIAVCGLSDVLLLTDAGLFWGYQQNWVVT